MTEPLTLPEQKHVALAIITSDQGVLVARRSDGIPPCTFPGGEIEPGEPAGQAIRRKVRRDRADRDLAVSSAGDCTRRPRA